MMRSALWAVVASFAAMLVPASGWAQTSTSAASQSSTDCRLRIDTAATNWLIDNFDPFGGGAAAGAYDVLFINDGDGACRFYPRFDTDQATIGLRTEAGSTVPYTLLDTFGQYDATPLAGRTLRRVTNQPVVLVPRGQQLVRYILNVPGDTIGGDGLFTQRLLLTAEDLSGAPLTQRQIVVGLRVAPSASLSLAGAFTRTGSQADIDLGELTEGVVAVPLQLHVLSTRGYRLTVNSLNNGRLRLFGTDWTIPYTLAIEGRPVLLGSNGGYLSGNDSAIHRDALSLSFSIGDASQQRAGAYSDLLTVTVATI